MIPMFLYGSDLRPYLVKIPAQWKLIAMPGPAVAYFHDNTQVLFSVGDYGGDLWMHVSACKRYGPDQWAIPSYPTMARLKADFLGSDRHAYMVFPAAEEHVNIHPHVLHLWARADGSRALPDFRVLVDGVVGI